MESKRRAHSGGRDPHLTRQRTLFNRAQQIIGVVSANALMAPTRLNMPLTGVNDLFHNLDKSVHTFSYIVL